MKRLFFIFMLTSLLTAFPSDPSYSQESNQSRSKSFFSRFSVGGNFGLQFGTITGIQVSPEVIFRAVDQLHFGLGFSYQYLRYRDYFLDRQTSDYLDLSINVWGGRIFSRYYLSSIFTNEILGNLFGHVEYEYLTYVLPYEPAPMGSGTIYDPFGYEYKEGKDVKEINSIFVGGGYKQPLGKHAFMDILVLYNLNETYDSPYSNPVIRLGFGYGF